MPMILSHSSFHGCNLPILSRTMIIIILMTFLRYLLLHVITRGGYSYHSVLWLRNWALKRLRNLPKVKQLAKVRDEMQTQLKSIINCCLPKWKTLPIDSGEGLNCPVRQSRSWWHLSLWCQVPRFYNSLGGAKINKLQQRMVAHTCYPNYWEAEAGG